MGEGNTLEAGIRSEEAEARRTTAAGRARCDHRRSRSRIEELEKRIGTGGVSIPLESRIPWNLV